MGGGEDKDSKSPLLSRKRTKFRNFYLKIQKKSKAQLDITNTPYDPILLLREAAKKALPPPLLELRGHNIFRNIFLMLQKKFFS